MTGSDEERDQILTDLISSGSTPEDAANVYHQLLMSEKPTAGLLPSVDSMQANTGTFAAKSLLPVAGQIGGAAIGNVAGRALAGRIPSLAGSGLAPSLGRLGMQALGEGAGVFAGMLGGQAVAKEPLDIRNAGTAAFWQMLLSGGMGAVVPPAGRSGGVSLGASRAAVGRPEFTKHVPQHSESVLAKEIGVTARDLPKTQGRARIESSILAHDSAGQPFVDGLEIVNRARTKIPMGVSPESRSARTRMMRDLDHLEDLIKSESAQNIPGPGQQVYPLTAEQADRIIRENMTQPIASEFERIPGGNVYTSARVEARNEAAKTLYKSLGGDAPIDAAAASQALKVKKDIMDEFPLDELGDPKKVAVANVAAAGSHTNINAPVLLKKLERLDDWNRPNTITGQQTMKDRVIELGYKREWQSSYDAEGARILAAAGISSPSRITSPGWIRDGIRAIARLLVKSQGKIGAAARAGAVAPFTYDTKEKQVKTFEGAMRGDK